MVFHDEALIGKEGLLDGDAPWPVVGIAVTLETDRACHRRSSRKGVAKIVEPKIDERGCRAQQIIRDP